MPKHSNDKLYNIDPLLPLAAEGFHFLTPNYRLARRIKAVWDAHQAALGKTVWEPVPITPLEAWLGERWHSAVDLGLLEPRCCLNEGQVSELWQQAIDSHEQASGQYTLLRPAAAGRIAAQARDTLLRWGIDCKASAVRQQFSLDEDCATFLDWLEVFEARLARDGLLARVDCVVQLAGVAQHMPGRPIALLDFDDIPPLYRQCIDALATEVREHQSGGLESPISVNSYPDRRSELQAAARWARSCREADPHSSIGIIVPDLPTEKPALEHLLNQEFETLGKPYPSLPVNFSAGTALDQVPVVRDGLMALKLCLPTASVPEFTALLQSRFLALPDCPSPRVNRFLRHLYQDGQEQIEVADLRYRAARVAPGESGSLVVGEHLLAVSQMRELKRKHLPSDWVPLLMEVLSVWGWPGPAPLDSLEYQQVEMWYRVLEDFSAFDRVCPSLDLAGALSLLIKATSDTVFQPKTDDNHLQVLGMLEGAGLAFDYVWLCALQASNWPPPARPNPFIPVALQRAHQMPHATAEREWEFAQGLVSRYARVCGEVFASFSQAMDGVPELPSAVLEPYPVTVNTTTSEPPEQWLAQRAEGAREQYLETQAPSVREPELTQLRGGSGLIEDQSQCPFRAFAKRRLAARTLGDFYTGLSAADRGSLLHDALFVLWGELVDSKTLHSTTDEALSVLLEQAIETAMSALVQKRRHLGQAYLNVEARRLHAVLLQWLEVERERADFVVAQREQQVELTLGTLAITLRVDRVDRLPDDSLCIIDYKTGSSNTSGWIGARPGTPQLLLYGLATPEPVSALGFAQVRTRDCKYVGAAGAEVGPGFATDIGRLVRERMAADDWAGLNEQWAQILHGLAQQFLAGASAVDPLATDSCTYCGLQPLCRIEDTVESSS